MAIQVKAIEQYFPVLLFIVLDKVVTTFESVDEILKCDHSFESCWAALCAEEFVFQLWPRKKKLEFLLILYSKNNTKRQNIHVHVSIPYLPTFPFS